MPRSNTPTPHDSLRPRPLLGRVSSFGYGKYECLGHGGTEPHVLPKEIEAVRCRCGDRLSWGAVCAGTHLRRRRLFMGSRAGPRARRAFRRPPADGAVPSRLPKRIEALRGALERCIAAGGSHSCAATDEGHVYTWGEGQTGALGHMDFDDELLPKRVEMLHENGVCAVRVAASIKHTLVADPASSTRLWRMRTGPSGASVVSMQSGLGTSCCEGDAGRRGRQHRG
jgi:E3 ubiquitin-protein ligase HERC2